MPHPNHIYASIARASRRNRLEGIAADGVRAIDALIEQMRREDPSANWEDVVRRIRIEGQPLDPEQVSAAIQLREARRQGLLLPGDEA